MIYMFLADGFEEVEALTPLDLIIRAGLPIKTVGVNGLNVTGAHGIVVKADITESDLSFDSIDMVILPGGMPGTTNLLNSQICIDAVKTTYEKNKPIASICAAPMILGSLGILSGKNAVCFPGFENELANANVLSSAVCTDGNIITAAGMGVAFDFGLAIVEMLLGKEKSEELYNSTQAFRQNQ